MTQIIVKRERTRFHEFAFEFKFDRSILAICRILKEKVGWKEFTFYEQKWRCVNAPTILEFMKLVNDDSSFILSGDVALVVSAMKEQRGEMFSRHTRAKELKNLKDTDFEVKNVKGELYPYQKIGVEFLVNSGCKAILSDACGVGKTAQALATIAHMNFQRVLVLCPASVKFAWKNETRKWTSLEPIVLSSGDNIAKRLKENGNIYIINYDLIIKNSTLTALQGVRWDCIICDESHYIKSKTSKRSRAVKLLSQICPKILFLSGTPFLNRPEELFTSLNMIDPIQFGDYYKFTAKFCGGHRGVYGWEAKGATNINDLRERIDRLFIRRTKEEVLKDLPKKVFVNIPIELDKRVRQDYDLAYDRFTDYLRLIKNTPQHRLAELDWAAQRLMRLNELRMITTRGKIEAAEEIIQNVISSGEKIVVFSCYQEPLEWLQEKFGDSAVLITGNVDTKDRAEIVDRFQTDPSCIVFLGGMKSAGVGITLTAATNALFIDYSWTPADHIQAQDRVHRIGSKGSSVNIFQLYAENTIDEKIVGMLGEKQKIFDMLIEGKSMAPEVRSLGKEVHSDSIIDELIRTISNPRKLKAP